MIMIPLAKEHMKITLALTTLIPILFFYSLLYQWLGYFILLVVLILVFHIFFLRDPSRVIIENSELIFAPADGKVYEVLPDEGIIRIRMSLFNVHVNRWPVSGRIIKITQQSGTYWPFEQAICTSWPSAVSRSIRGSNSFFAVISTAAI